jgi:hypothetical protein
VTTWITTPAEFKVIYSPVGLRLLDELTNQAPLGSVQAILDIQDSAGAWRTTDIKDNRTPDDVVTYCNLERHAVVTGLPSRQYRVRLIADYYLPYYRINAEGIAFTAYPYNDNHPPAQIVRVPIDTPLLPAPNYPFASYIPVLRGTVVDAAGKLVQDASVTQGNNERALTDAQGRFALPLRWVQPNVAVPIDATDQRTGHTGSINVQIPAALGKNQTISIT